jgi:D-glycero-alpha-D-manno-heptose-7-phosphate kinase
VSLFGGGTDRPEYYNQTGHGKVLSFTIDKYLHVVLNKVDNNALKLMYSKIETVTDVDQLDHDIVRNVWKYWPELGMGWEIASFADLPTVGTGLGSSSSFTVALLEALSNYNIFQKGVRFDPMSIAKLACMVEMDLCKSPIGKQDQYATALGGLNMLEFRPGHVQQHDISGYGGDLEANLMLFYTGITRNTNEILSQQKIEGAVLETLAKIEDQVEEAHDVITTSWHDMTRIGQLLHEGWELKRSLPGVTNPIIDNLYERARNAGALGGKILGAGGGGFLLFFVEPDNQQAVRNALLPLKETVFSIVPVGVKTLVHND